MDDFCGTANLRIAKIWDDIYQIRVPIPNNPLRDTNAYFIRGTTVDLLIDTGFRLDVCKEALDDALSFLGSQKERRQVLCTHMHGDHCGLADIFAGDDQPIYMSDEDLVFWRQFRNGPLQAERVCRYRREGLTEELIQQFGKNGGAYPLSMSTSDARLTALHNGDMLCVGDMQLEIVLTPGHTPGHIMLWSSDRRIMFTGDHILFDITPNITYWPSIRNSLGDYLRSLNDVKMYPVSLALSGHRENGRYNVRIDEILAHHRERLQEVLSVVSERDGITAFEIAQRLHWHTHSRKWDEFPAKQQWFAFGECLAHIDHLLDEGRLQRKTENDIYRYHIPETMTYD